METQVRRQRLTHGYTIADVCKGVGIWEQYYLELEFGLAEVTESLADAFGKFYNKKPEDFLSTPDVKNFKAEVINHNADGGRGISNVNRYYEIQHVHVHLQRYADSAQNVVKRVYKNLREIREACPHSEKQVAKPLGIDAGTYREIESGERCLTIERMAELSVFYETDIIYFILLLLTDNPIAWVIGE